MINQKKPTVVMTVSGNAKNYINGSDIREILDEVYNEYQHAGQDWDRPDRLFIGGKLIVDKRLADIALEYGKFYRQKDDEVEAALDEWIEQRFHQKEAL